MAEERNNDDDYVTDEKNVPLYESADVDPPNNRLFVVCDKLSTEEEIRESFGRFGQLKEVRILVDRHTEQSKGIAYVKFAKTSQAAKAMEALDGKTIENSNRPIKVMIASDRSKGSSREPNEQDRFYRLFVVISKDAEEETLREHFGQFGRVANVMIIRNKKTGESKGVAFVRFTKASHAALAYENCDRTYKAKFAEPRPLKMHNVDSHHGNAFDPSGWPGNHPQHRGSSRLDDDYGVRPQRDVVAPDRLQVVASAGVTQQQLWKLFDLIPDLEYCDVHMRKLDSEGDPVLATVKYRSLQSTSWALSKLNNFEYPPGKPLAVREATDFDSDRRRSNDLNFSSVIPEVSKLAEALAQAHSIMKAAGLAVPTGDDHHAQRRHSERSSSPKPMDVCDSAGEQRLFVVCSPKVLPNFVLNDVFGRFQGLLSIRMLNGRNCGYVTYSTEESARRAIEAFNGQNVHGAQLVVKMADPMTTDRTSGSGMKRQKVN